MKTTNDERPTTNADGAVLVSSVVGRWSFVVRRSSFVVRRSSFVKPRQHHLPHRAHPALEGTEALVLAPEVVQLVFQVEVNAHGAEQPFIPLLGGEVLAEGGQIEDGDADALLAEAHNVRTMREDLPIWREVST